MYYYKERNKRDGCSDGYFIRRYARDVEKCRKAGAQRRVKTKKTNETVAFCPCLGGISRGNAGFNGGRKNYK
jgi:hypothetical protein